jgi:hypothetical protein
MKEIEQLSAYRTAYKDPTTGEAKSQGLLQEFFRSPISEGSKATLKQLYDRLLDTAVKEKDLKRLKLFAPNSEVGVKGFGE